MSRRGAGAPRRRPPHEGDQRPPGGEDRYLPRTPQNVPSGGGDRTPYEGSSGTPACGDGFPHGGGDRRPPDLGDLIVVLLAGSMAGLRDRLAADGFDEAADLVADLVELADEYIARVAP